MKKSYRSAILLVVITLFAMAAWAVTVTYNPPAQPGTIYTVIDYKRSLGTTVNTNVSVAWGTFNKSATITAPFDSCSQTFPAGFVLKLNHSNADSVPLTLSTTGTIVRGPYQGSAPAETQHSCYKTVSW
jgi:hypothetical protein